MNFKFRQIWLLAVVLFVTNACLAQTPTQSIGIAGLKESVNVWRDDRGIPYIEAKSETDLYFAQGFITAQDRLWQMDLYRRMARGETAEIFGQTVLEEDKRWRKFGFGHIVEETIKNSSAQNRTMLESYARGVNAYIATLDEKTLPVEFQLLQYRPRDWTPADSLVIGKIFDDALSNTWRMDLMKASLSDLPKEKFAAVFDTTSLLDVLLIGKDTAGAETPKRAGANNSDFLRQSASLFQKVNEIEKARKSSLDRAGFYAEDLAASNNWVVSGKRTIDGKPLLANDPHLRPAQPPIWYLANLTFPGVKIAGVTTPGIPGVIIGHNEHFAWGSTNVGPDVQDLYVETFNAEGKYRTPTGWESPVVRKEEIKVRKNPASTETTTETLEVLETRNGVIVLEEAGKRYALKWTARDSKNDILNSFSALGRAKNWNDFRNALKDYAGPMQNFVYADVQGNIGWIAAGKVPLRRTGDGSLPYDGATNDGEWIGFIPFEELPMLYNPPEGFIMTANQRTVGKSYKHHDLIARAHTVSRAKRLQDLLSANAKVSVSDMRDYMHDTFSVINSRFVREVINQKAASDETLKLFAGWDGRMNADSEAALLADTMRGVFRNKIMEGNRGAARAKTAFFPNEPAFFDQLVVNKPKEWLPKEFPSYADLLKASEIEARETLIKRVGTDRSKWTWGEANKIRFNHPLVVAPLIGMQFTVPALALNGSGGAGASPNVGAAVSMRFIATPGNWDSTRLGIPTGQSGDPKSAHYKDQLESWYNGSPPVFPFSKPAIEKAAKTSIVLSPK